MCNEWQQDFRIIQFVDVSRFIDRKCLKRWRTSSNNLLQHNRDENISLSVRGSKDFELRFAHRVTEMNHRLYAHRDTSRCAYKSQPIWQMTLFFREILARGQNEYRHYRRSDFHQIFANNVDILPILSNKELKVLELRVGACNSQSTRVIIV